MNLEFVALMLKNQKKIKLGEKIESKSNETLQNITHFLNMNLEFVALMFKNQKEMKLGEKIESKSKRRSKTSPFT